MRSYPAEVEVTDAERIAYAYRMDAPSDGWTALVRAVGDALADLTEAARRTNQYDRLISRGYVRVTVSYGEPHVAGVVSDGWISPDQMHPHFRVEIEGGDGLIEREIAIARDFDAALAAWGAARTKFTDREVILRQGARIMRRSSEHPG